MVRNSMMEAGSESHAITNAEKKLQYMYWRKVCVHLMQERGACGEKRCVPRDHDGRRAKAKADLPGGLAMNQHARLSFAVCNSSGLLGGPRLGTSPRSHVIISVFARSLAAGVPSPKWNLASHPEEAFPPLCRRPPSLLLHGLIISFAPNSGRYRSCRGWMGRAEEGEAPGSFASRAGEGGRISSPHLLSPQPALKPSRMYALLSPARLAPHRALCLSHQRPHCSL
jgi:hypothetical protein